VIILISYFQLFIISFLAATILPLSSELVLSTMLLTDSFDKYLLLVVASFGNILGSSVNWYLGKKILIFKDKKWFPANERQIAKGEIYFKKYGIWSLLLAWVPIIGDPLTVVAGILRVKFFTFLLLVSISKISRYIFLIFIIFK
jgi:membrane protein YqaA with SNARE-associated domain|tara:strand:- start:202 stop:633 length:432 start_codon:yes stop_codon:yes gene_type:complete